MQRYPVPLITSHWVIAIAVLVAYIASGNPTKPKDVFDFLAGQTHVIAGMTVFALTLARLPLKAFFRSNQAPL